MTRVRIGIGGWTYEPWRGVFYPKTVIQKDELRHAAQRLSSVEINGTFYGAQKPATFARWRDETPDDFVFAVKAPRYATHRKKLADAGPTIERFLNGGVAELKDKFGPINWQLMPSTRFDASDMEAFFKLLPPSVGEHPVRHAIEARHESFACAEFVVLARRYGVAVVVAGDAEYPQIADVTADFVYLRIMGTREGVPTGYPTAQLDRWAARVREYGAGRTPSDLRTVAGAGPQGAERDVFLYVISGHKVANPAAATALLGRLGGVIPQAPEPPTRPPATGRSGVRRKSPAKTAPAAKPGSAAKAKSPRRPVRRK